MPYKDDADRCRQHIKYLRRELAAARRAVKRIPKLQAEIAAWAERLTEHRALSGRKVATSTKRSHILHDLDNPGAQKFTSWRTLLVQVETSHITGYAVDSEGEVVNFKKGKRKGTDGRWYPAAGGVA